MSKIWIFEMGNLLPLCMKKVKIENIIEKSFSNLEDFFKFIKKEKCKIYLHSHTKSLNGFFNKSNLSVFCVIEKENKKYLVIKEGINDKKEIKKIISSYI